MTSAKTPGMVSSGQQKASGLSIGVKIAVGYGLALGAFLLIGIVSYRNIAQLNADDAWVRHTLLVEQKLDRITLGIVRASSATRAYIITGDAASIEKMRSFKPQIISDLQALRALTADNPDEQTRLDTLDPLVGERFAIFEQLIAMRQANKKPGDPAVTALVFQGQGEADQFRKLIDAMGNEEQELLQRREEQTQAVSKRTSGTLIGGTVAAFLLVLAAAVTVVRGILASLRKVNDAATRIGEGSYGHRIEEIGGDEVGQLALVFNRMAGQVEQRQAALAEQEWLKGSLGRFASLFQGQRDLAAVCRGLVSEIAEVLAVRHAALYLAETALSTASPRLRFQDGYAAVEPPRIIAPGEGLIGQCFLEKKNLFIDDIPAGYVRIESALGAAPPRSLAILPALFEGEVRGVAELAFFQAPTPIQRAFLSQLFDHFGMVLNAIESHRQLQESEQELQQQQEELRQTNEEMQQTNAELGLANAELEERADRLEEQRIEMESKNRQIELAQEALEQKAEQLAQSSKYKSEFLASMSHELRTPLNSLLILSKILAENPARNLTAKQVQYSETIHASGTDLLVLIDDILDLAKIESGTVEAEIAELSFVDLAKFVEGTFRHVAESKALAFDVELDPRLPAFFHTDGRRLQQVIKNLLANAFKFTLHGSVRLRIAPEAGGRISFAVSDTGVGIPAEKQQVIFEAFQQADAGTSRKYGGTGLGLSISREIARLLGGALDVASVVGQGSTFTLHLPTAPARAPAASRNRPAAERALPEGTSAPRPEEPEPEKGLVADDRASIGLGDFVLLVVEDDDHFSGLLADFAREKGFKVVVTRRAENVLFLAEKFHPAAITLDLRLPDQEGWIVLDRLKHNPSTRHIPVHVISVREERERSLRLGAVSCLKKPVSREEIDRLLTQARDFISRPVRNLLIVEDDLRQRQSIVELIGNGDVSAIAVGTGAEALDLLEAARFDCLVLDLGLPDISGFELIRKIQEQPWGRALPIIVYTGRDLTRAEETELQKVSEAIIIKDVKSPERLLDETALFLHRVQGRLPEAKRRIIEEARKSDSTLAGRTVLIVDDDLRNIFAVTAALEQYNMRVLYADNGQAALALLENTPEIEGVLMDVMMPEMDGFEAMRRIRANPAHRKLPILAITAKAMKGDREKCLEAGASDYVTKPIDMDQLRSLLRVWLYK